MTKALLDVRMDNSVDISHLKYILGCDEYIYLPFDEAVSSDLEAMLDKSRVYYVVCNRGNKSMYITNILIQKGYKAINIEGGVESFKKNSVLLND